MRLTPCLRGCGLAGRISIVPKAFPLEFRRDVIAVARKGEAAISQVARDFEISESCVCSAG
jgi:transposase-like protein